ncbi:unnamed protein product, partial [Discosporangium mesarthrocarpum]
GSPLLPTEESKAIFYQAPDQRSPHGHVDASANISFLQPHIGQEQGGLESHDGAWGREEVGLEMSGCREQRDQGQGGTGQVAVLTHLRLLSGGAEGKGGDVSKLRKVPLQDLTDWRRSSADDRSGGLGDSGEHGHEITMAKAAEARQVMEISEGSKHLLSKQDRGHGQHVLAHHLESSPSSPAPVEAADPDAEIELEPQALQLHGDALANDSGAGKADRMGER